jgi:ribose transport system ATP-binding protein
VRAKGSTTDVGPAPRPGGGDGPAVAPLVEVRGLVKQFGGIRAVDDVSTEIHAGRVTALVGANGAGKSTLVKLISGAAAPDAGEILVDGQPTTLHSPRDAARLGFSVVHQELHLVPTFTVAQNMALGYDSASDRGVLQPRAMRERAREVLAMLRRPIDVDRRVSELPVSDRWTVALGRALMNETRLVIMDEPTASFSAAQTDSLFEVIRDLSDRGVGIVYISHRLEEILEICDTITVMRDGRVVGSLAGGETTPETLANAIVGREVRRLERQHHAPPAHETAPTLTAAGLRALPRLRDVSLSVWPGEILGIAGLVGSGRTELLRLFAGADRPETGEMTLGGRAYAPRNVYDAIRQGVALVPEERRAAGLVLTESIAFNVNLATLRDSRWHPRLPLLSRRRAAEAAQEAVRRFDIRCAGVNQPVGALSGGNQQKVVVSRFVKAAPKVLLLDEPTMGVDVGARAELFGIIRGLAEAGAAVILVSSDFDELGICDRVAVLAQGQLVASVTGDEITPDNLTHLAYTREERDD